MRYCPYLGEETDGKFNLEHIFPEAIGGRLDYSINVSECINSHFGTRVDAPLIAHPWIKARCVCWGIKNKDGRLPNLKLKAESPTTGLKYEINASSAKGIKVSTRDRIKDDLENPGKKILSTLPDAEAEDMKRIEADVKKDNKEVVWEKAWTLAEDEAVVDNEGNPFGAALGLAKIAFGGLLHAFPEYAQDPMAAAWRKLLAAKTPEEAAKAEIEYGVYDCPGAVKAIVPIEIQDHEHVVSIASVPPTGLLVAVSLFGLSEFHLFAVASKTLYYGMEPGDIRMQICDTRAAKGDPKAPITREEKCRKIIDVDSKGVNDSNIA